MPLPAASPLLIVLSAGVDGVVGLGGDVAELVQARELLVVRQIGAAVAQPELLAIAGKANAEPSEGAGGAVDREQRDRLGQVAEFADRLAVEVGLLASDVVEQLRGRAVCAELFDGEVFAAEPAPVDARADSDRRRGVDVEVGDHVRAALRLWRSCAKHDTPVHPRVWTHLCERQEHVANAQPRVLQDEEGRAGAESAAHAAVLPPESDAVALLRRVVQGDVDVRHVDELVVRPEVRRELREYGAAVDRDDVGVVFGVGGVDVECARGARQRVGCVADARVVHAARGARRSDRLAWDAAEG